MRTPSPSPSPRRGLWLLGAALSVAIVLVVVASLEGDRAPAPDDSSAGVPPQVEERPLAPPSVSPPDQRSGGSPGPGPSGAQGPAPASAPGAPEQPPTAVSKVAEKKLEVPPEAPQTAEWKLEKTELIADSLGRRMQRLEAELRQAEARGDREGAARQRTLLERSRQRVAELEREIASLREQVRADGGQARDASAP